jgi:hypothetical protein
MVLFSWFSSKGEVSRRAVCFREVVEVLKEAGKIAERERKEAGPRGKPGTIPF